MDRRAIRAIGGVLLLAGLGFWQLAEGGSALPKAGARLPDLIRDARMRNAPVDEQAPRGGWVIYAFSPSSSGAAANAAHVERLAKSLPSDWLLLTVAMEAQGVAEFVDRHRVTVPVLTQIPEKALGPYRITATPRTYILDKDWKLLEILDGPYQGKVARKLQSRFKVKLPPAGSDRASGRAEPASPSASSLCRDREQDRYSSGAKADVLGLKFRCGAGGVWMPAT